MRSPSAWLVAAAAAFVASIGVIGADVLWAVPLGRLVAHGSLPGSVPFAAAASSGWHDVPAAAELVLWASYHGVGGLQGLLVAQVVCAAIGFGGLAAGLRAESRAGGVLAVSALVLAGSLPAVVVVSISMFSLALFPLLLWLLERESRTPGRRLWFAVPLLAVWGNLHGSVLIGWALLACYLLLARLRREPGLALGVLGASTVALALTPALWRTPLYYRGVFESAPARRGTDLWMPLGTGALDLLLVAVAAVLVGLALAGGRHFRLWEVVALAGLAAATVHVWRTGVFFLFLAAYPAARGLQLRGPRPRLLSVAAAVLAAGALWGLVRGPRDPGSKGLAAAAARTRRPVLATALLAGQVAADGGRVWIGNPIDAFRPSDQRLYLDWLAGRPAGAPAVTRARYVLVAQGSTAARLAAHDPRLELVHSDGDAALYLVRGV